MVPDGIFMVRSENSVYSMNSGENKVMKARITGFHLNEKEEADRDKARFNPVHLFLFFSLFCFFLFLLFIFFASFHCFHRSNFAY